MTDVTGGTDGGTEGPRGHEVIGARAPATEGPESHEAGTRTDDAAVPRRVFFAIGVVIAILAAVYGTTSHEDAGTVMIIVAAVLALWCGAYLWLQQRPRDDQRPAEAPGEPGGTTAYLPHSSGWPFSIGLGAATVANGLVLGIWVTIPGLALMALGLGGFILQSRRRE